MSASVALGTAPPPADGPEVTVEPFVRSGGDGRSTLHLMVEGVHCGGCVRTIERALLADPAVEHARVNLSTRRLVVGWRGGPGLGGRIAATVERAGFRAVPYDPDQLRGADEVRDRQLLRALAVAGFAAGNVMLLSVAVWAGAFQDMGPATRSLMHWFSALIALPAIAYAGRPFFGSAFDALRHGRTNMDVPISLAVVLAGSMSLFETIRHGEHVYFDSAVMLLFFLLIGRYLDHRARGQARSAAERLVALERGFVTVLDAAGVRHAVPAADVAPGATVLAGAGERIGVDGAVIAGAGEVDTSLITGESVPERVAPGSRVFAGTLNLGAPLRIAASAAGDGTLLAEIVRLMEAAEQRRARFVVLADRIARAYAPAVHSLALITFLAWWLVLGAAWQVALLYAIAVLIITCPCALALAVPAVQVIASGRLFRSGVLLKSATALERLAEVDHVVLDKTGTLSLGRPTLAAVEAVPEDDLRLAAGLAGGSRHPLARALAAQVPDAPAAEGVAEVPGQGLRLGLPDGEIRLGSRAFAGPPGEAPEDDRLELWLARPGAAPRRLAFGDRLRDDAAPTLRRLEALGLEVEMLSGDRRPAAAAVAKALGIDHWSAGRSPADKVARLEALGAAGCKVLMVGDGLNDAPALAAAHVSISPSSAIDISQNTADAVFQGDRLMPVALTIEVARRARRLIRQNLALALAYNLITVPLAMAGLVTPLIAALSMSASSLLVVGNALRLQLRGQP
ncbi:MAG TPA: heavy metal translocating P-type ATPase [Geminicoccaceae bacterium]